MGMFDTIYCDMPLPDGYESRLNGFQTKDFDCEMARYRIKASGSLVKETYGVFNSEPMLTGTVIPFHGIIRFYDYDQQSCDPKFLYDQQHWHEYNAKFTDGKCVGIELAQPEVTEHVGIEK